ncbi:hypothetical protein CEXT_431811 [Caerostris extrusa]|uniref:Uncharacterized protein n=1 Tax=Caerostris extrusa TaxID=172846 RepID=A0AAV4YCX9_CAEEX|nr:hypothetical protein CEXT_431811 [Caerostris extrusa]
MHDPEPTENVSGIFIRKIYPVEIPGNNKLLQDNLHRRLQDCGLILSCLLSLFYLRDVKLGVVLFISLRKRRHNLVDFRIIEDEEIVSNDLASLSFTAIIYNENIYLLKKLSVVGNNNYLAHYNGRNTILITQVYMMSMAVF